MKASELKDLQAPLKEQYREKPDSAVITLTASGALDESAIACKVDTGRAMVEAGLHPATGGSGTGRLRRGYVKGGSDGLGVRS